MYSCELSLSDPEIRSRCVDWLAEYQLRRVQFEPRFGVVVIDGRENLKLLAVFKRAPRHALTKNLELNQCMTAADGNVLIEVAELVQLPQGVGLHALPSEMRLERLDDLNSLAWDVQCRAHEPLSIAGGIAGVDRECAGSARCSAA